MFRNARRVFSKREFLSHTLSESAGKVKRIDDDTGRRFHRPMRRPADIDSRWRNQLERNAEALNRRICFPERTRKTTRRRCARVKYLSARCQVSEPSRTNDRGPLCLFYVFFFVCVCPFFFVWAAKKKANKQQRVRLVRPVRNPIRRYHEKVDSSPAASRFI